MLGWLDPEQLFGSLLFPMVSMAVALILFEGSLTLHLSEWREIGSVVRRMVTVGALSTLGVIAIATHHYLLGFARDMALLFGTLTGIWLANRQGVDARHSLHFKENLSVLERPAAANRLDPGRADRAAKPGWRGLRAAKPGGHMTNRRPRLLLVGWRPRAGSTMISLRHRS